MKMRVEVRELRKGMYVAELDREWVGTPFLFQGFEISSDEELARLTEWCQHVYVDVAEPGAPVVRPKRGPAIVHTTGPLASVGGAGAVPADGSEIAVTVRTRASAPSVPARSTIISRTRPPEARILVTVEEELPQAREIEQNFRKVIATIMDDAHLGRSFDAPRTRILVAQMVESIQRNPDAFLWLTHLKEKDAYTALHCLRVSVISVMFGRHLGLGVEQLNLLGMGALLHDIGKIRVPNEILNKPGRLTPEEFEIMKSHVPEGVRLLESTSGVPAPAVDVARRHHERYDGAGYANGLSGDHIGRFSLIAAIVDTFDALTSDRVYRAGISPSDALKMLYEGRGRNFHVDLVDEFIQCLGIYPLGSIVELSDGQIGVVSSINRQWRLRPRVTVVLDRNHHPRNPPAIIDLLHVSEPLEVRRVLPAGTAGINPASYLPGP